MRHRAGNPTERERIVDVIQPLLLGPHVHQTRPRIGQSQQQVVLAGIRPLIETMPLERANEGYKRMMSSDVKFRIVLTIGQAA